MTTTTGLVVAGGNGTAGMATVEGPRRNGSDGEHVAAMRSLWYDERPEYHGEFTDFVGVDAHPRPVQREIPIIVGDMMKPALRRSLKLGHGCSGCTSRRRSWPNAWNR